jgi:hypothetical protein
VGLGQRIRSRPGRLSAAVLFGSYCVGLEGEYRRVHAPRSALSLPKIPRRSQTAWAWNLVWEWELGLGTVLGHRPHASVRWQQRDRAAVSIGTSTLRPPRVSARKLLLSQRSLRTQDRSRGAPPEAPTPGASLSKSPAGDMLEWLFLCK